MAHEVWYRLEDSRIRSFDPDGDLLPGGSRADVLVLPLQVLRHTPCGTWVMHGRPRFILAGARRRYACATLEEAILSYQARKRAQRRIMKARARHADECLQIAKTVLAKHRAELASKGTET